MSDHIRFKAAPLKASFLRNIGADHFTFDDIAEIEEVMLDTLSMVFGGVIPAVIRRRLVPRFIPLATPSRH